MLDSYLCKSSTVNCREAIAGGDHKQRVMAGGEPPQILHHATIARLKYIDQHFLKNTVMIVRVTDSYVRNR